VSYTIDIPGTLSEYKLVIPGRLPGLNEYTDANRRHAQKGARMKRECQDLVQWQILSQLRRVRFAGPVFLLFTFFEADRRRDHDNVSSFARKVIQDALVEAGTLVGDGWKGVAGYMDRFEVDAKKPRIVVEFIEQEAEPCSKQPNKRSAK
jgi:hypothetical protein